MARLDGKIALVTGAGRGIGSACAVELAREGADVIINDRPGSESISDVERQIQQLGRKCVVIEADVFARTGCERLVAEAHQWAGQIDILVSNPAMNTRCGFLDADPDDFIRIVQATLISGFHMGQLVARRMVSRGAGGKIVFMSSVQAELPMAGNIAYGPSKAGLNHLARSIAMELAPHRIQVNAIEPGWIDTPGEHESFSDELIAAEGERLPLGRLGTPHDIGRAAVYLSSSDSDYITGSVLVVDGGFRYRSCMADAVLAPDKR